MTRLPHGIWVVVAGTSDAEIFINLGEGEECHLKQIPRDMIGGGLSQAAFEEAVKADDDLASGEPLLLGEEASGLIELLRDADTQDQFEELLIAAPEPTLEILRDAMPLSLKNKVMKAVAVDLSGQSFDLIEQRLLSHLTVDDAA